MQPSVGNSFELNKWNRALEEFQQKVDSLVKADPYGAEGNIGYPPTIYHYTDVKGALGILQTGKLWFTERTHLNDPMEIQYGLKIAHELFETAAKKRGAKIPIDIASHLKGEHVFGLSAYGFWIFSASLEGDDLNQWRHYADDGRGVCLGFSTEKFNADELTRFLPNNPYRLRYLVNYDENNLRRRVSPYVEAGLDLLEAADLPACSSYYQRNGQALLYERDVLRALNNGFYANSLLFKHAAYSLEEEYRLLITDFRNTTARSDCHLLRERRGEIVGYLDLPIPAWKQGVLTDICVGPAASPQLEEQLQVTLATLGLSVRRINRSEIPYRSTRQ